MCNATISKFVFKWIVYLCEAVYGMIAFGPRLSIDQSPESIIYLCSVDVRFEKTKQILFHYPKSKWVFPNKK